MATISNTPRPGYVWDATDNCWYPIGTGPHSHADYITAGSAINPNIVDAKGDIIAATAADTVARLAVGANDTVLTADSTTATGLKWAAPAAGGMTLISTTTLSGSSVTLSSIPSTYNDLRLVLRLPLPATDGNYLTFNYNSDTGSNYFGTPLGNNYYDNNPITSGAFVTSAYLTGDAATMDNAVTQGTVIWNIYDYANTSTYKFSESRYIANNHTTPTSIFLGAYKQIWRQTSAISSITVQFVGNFTSGTVLLYGVK